MSARRPSPLDALGAVALAALVWCYAASFLDFARHPEEDAAMLLRYSRHLAQGQGIVWNVGEPPVDGATDFLFMAGVALLHRAGLSLETSARALGLAAHGLTAIAVFLSIRTLFGASHPMALLPAAYLAVGTGLRYVTACYGTTLFALTAAVAWHLAWRTAQAEPDRLHAHALALGLASVVMGLARPEGVFLGLLFLASVVLARGRAKAGAALRAFAIGFLLLGLAYFLWRWSYFGDPLPNPFYKKGGGVLHWDVLARSLRNVARLGGPFLLVLLAGLLFPRTRPPALVALAPVAGFAALWVLISDETNYFMRFRYPILPVVLVSWVPVWQGLTERLGRRAAIDRSPLARAVAVAAALVVAAVLVAWQHRRFSGIEPQRMGLYDVALMLRPYADRGYALATTEAGLLPLYSEWRAVDAWGLNDRWIAHHGGVTEEYLERYRPELIAFHAYFSPGVPREGPRVEGRGLGRPWFDMVTMLQRYAERRGYTLAAVYGRSPYDTHYYYVRPGFPQEPEIVGRIRAMRYLWNGHPAEEFAGAAAAVSSSP